MNPNEKICDSQRIDDYLDERLSEALASEFERHLSDCECCRNELQKRSAEPQVWQDAGALLRPTSSPPSPSPGSTLSDWNDPPASGDLATGEPGSSQRERYVLSVLAALAPTDDPEMLGRVGDYEIIGVVGVGGMGAVLKGFDKSLRRVVAIKVMAPHLAHSGSARTRFQREARAAAAITHDNVIDIYAVSEAAGLPYLVMPYARGPSLQKRIDEGGPLGVIEVVRIGRQIAAGLAAAHEQGLVHRDIKPANILLSDGIERLWITDFGVARAMDDASMTQTGVIAGTPQYMSPEQARGEMVDQRSDLFSLGSVLYTACTGRPPFRSEAAYGILRRITDSDPRPIREVNADIPEWLCLIIDRLLAKHPADRFESAGEVVELLDGCLAHLQQPLQVELPPSLRCKPMRDENRPPPALEGQRSEPQLQPTGRLLPAQQSRRQFSKRGLVMTGSILLAGLLGFLTMQLTGPIDISGHWAGESWQHVSLASVDEASDWYSGTFVDATGRRGALRLEWSRLQRRYNGRWKIGDGESGQITLRASDNGTLRGAVSVDPEAQLGPDVPRLLEFAWQRASKEAQHDFESHAGNSDWQPRESSQQVAGHAVSIKSPKPAILVRLADGVKLNARVKRGDFIAEIELNESASTTNRQEQFTALRRKTDVATSRIVAAERDLDAARQICTAIEAQIKNLESAKSELQAGTKSELVQAQGNLDAALVDLKKAEADVSKFETELQLALKELRSLEQEIGDLQIKLQELNRRRIEAPVGGRVTYLATIGSGMLEEGDVICEITPDLVAATASPETPDRTVGTQPAVPDSEPRLNDPIQSLSAFGPPSGLAKRLRESQQKLARITASLEACEAEINATQKQLLELSEKQSQAKEEDASLRNQLEQQLIFIHSKKKTTEQEIVHLNAEKKLVDAELKEATHEQQTILQILETQLLAAAGQLEFRRAALERLQLNRKNGLSSEDDVVQAEQATTVAKSEVRRLELVIEFYSNLGKAQSE